MEQYFLKKSTASVFQPNAVPQLSYIYVTGAENGTWFRGAHSHGNIVEISLIAEGAVCYAINGMCLPAKKGDLIIVNAGMTHEEKSGDPDVCICCLGVRNLSLTGRKRNILLENDTIPLFSGTSCNETAAVLIRAICERVRAKESLCRDETVRHLLCALICVILDAEQEQRIQAQTGDSATSYKNDEKKTLRRIREYLDQNYAEVISLDALAGDFFIGKYHMCHSFKERYGCSIIDYVIGRRIGEAQTLLVETDRRIADIASELGFSSAGYFSTQFLKRTGITPIEYRALKKG